MRASGTPHGAIGVTRTGYRARLSSSPSPRQWLQARVTLSSDDPEVFPTLRSLTFIANDPVITSGLSGYVFPREAALDSLMEFRYTIKPVSFRSTDVGFDHVESIRSLLQPEKSGKTIELPGAIEVERNFDTLVFAETIGGKADYDYALEIPGCVLVPEIGCVIEARISSPDEAKPNRGRVLVDGESLGPYVRIRNWRNGDFYSPVGLRAAKLKQLFQDQRIPRRQRHRLPVLVTESAIVWVASFPVSREFAPTGRSRRIIEFEASLVAQGK